MPRVSLNTGAGAVHFNLGGIGFCAFVACYWLAAIVREVWKRRKP